MKELQIKKAFRYGFITFRSHIKMLLGLMASIAVIYYAIIFSVITAAEYKFVCDMKQAGFVYGDGLLQTWIARYFMSGLADFSSWVTLFVAGIVFALTFSWSYAATINVCLNLRDNDRASFGNLFDFIREMPTLLYAWAVIAGVGFFGLIALIVPGLYWFLRTAFAYEVILDPSVKDKRPVSYSLNLTRGHVMKLVGFLLLAGGIVILFSLVQLASVAGLSPMCMLFPKILQQMNCMVVVRLISIVFIWASTVIITLAKIDLYRQLNPR